MAEYDGVYGSNGISNPDFEDDVFPTSDWAPYQISANTTLTRSSEVTPDTGSFVGKAVAAGASDWGVQHMGSSPGPVQGPVPRAGEQWQARMKVRGVGSSIGDNVQTVLQANGSAGGSQNGNVTDLTLTADWQWTPFTAITVTNDDHTGFWLFHFLSTGGATGDIWYIDGAELYRFPTKSIRPDYSLYGSR